MRARERVAYAKTLLAEAGLEADRLEMVHIGASDAPLWAQKVREMTDRIRDLGPNPVRRRARAGGQRSEGRGRMTDNSR